MQQYRQPPSEMSPLTGVLNSSLRIWLLFCNVVTLSRKASSIDFFQQLVIKCSNMKKS